MNIEPEVGQVWRSPTGIHERTITRVKSNTISYAWCNKESGAGGNSEMLLSTWRKEMGTLLSPSPFAHEIIDMLGEPKEI